MSRTEPLLEDVVEEHPELDIHTVNADGIFNSQPCRDTVQEKLGEDAKLNTAVNRRRKQDIQQPARGIAQITKHGSVQCISGQNMVFLTKDTSLDAYLFGCPVLNEEARCKLEHMGIDVPEQRSCDKQAECCPNAEQGHIHRVPRTMLSQIDNPQFSYRFKLEYAARTKIEQLIGRMKGRLKMSHLYKRGVANIRGHVLKFYNSFLAYGIGTLEPVAHPGQCHRHLRRVTGQEWQVGRRGNWMEGGVRPETDPNQQKTRFSLRRGPELGKRSLSLCAQEGNGRHGTLICAVAQITAHK